jgi:hypothetical protein
MFRPFRELGLVLILIATLVASSVNPASALAKPPADGIQIPVGLNAKMLKKEIQSGRKEFRLSLAASMPPRRGTWV